MTRSTVISKLITKFDAVINGNDSGAIELAVFKLAICQLVDAAFASSGGGGGGGGTTAQVISDGIDQSVDVSAIITRLTSLDTGKLTTADITTAIQTAAKIDTIITRLTSLTTSNLTQANVEAAIQNAADIDTIIARLTAINTNTVSTPITAYTMSSLAIVDTAIDVLAVNVNRKGAIIINRSNTNSVDLFFGVSGVYGAGLPLAPGQSYEIDRSNLYTGAIRSIAGTGITAILAVAEGT